MAKVRGSPDTQLSLLLVVVEMAAGPAANQAVGSSEPTQDAPTSQTSAVSDVEDHGSERDPDRETNVVRLHGESGNASAPLVLMKTVADVTHVNATGAVPEGVVQDNGPATAEGAVIIAAVAANGHVAAQVPAWVGFEEDFRIQVANNNDEVLGEDLEAVKDAESVRERLKTRTLGYDGELPSEVSSSSERGDDIEDSPEMTLATTEEYLALIKTVENSDIDPLRKAGHIMVATGKSPHELIEMGHAGIDAYLRTNPVSRNGELCRNPPGTATRILLCLKRLGERHPGAGLPIITYSTKAPKVPLMPLADEPPAILADRRAWVAKFKAEADDADPETAETTTCKSYVQSSRMVVSVGCRLGVIDQKASTSSLCDPAVYGPIIAELDKLLTPANVASVLSGMLRILRDTLEGNSAHAENLTLFETEVGRCFPDQALSDEQLDQITGLLDDGTAVTTLLNAPRAIEARANAAGLKPQDKLGRRAAAIAWAIKLDRPGLDPAHLARLDGLYYFRARHGKMEVRFPDPTNAVKWLWKPVDAQTERLVNVWRSFRTEMGLVPTLLFPGADGLPRETRCAMKLVYDEIECAIGVRYTFNYIKDVLTYAALDADPDAVEAVAEEAGIKDPRSMRRRMVRVLRKRGRPE